MKRRTLLHTVVALGGYAALGPWSLAQAAKSGPLHIIVPYAPGGSSDRVARIVGEKLRTKLGRDVLVENKPGGGGRVAAQQVKRVRANQDDTLILANPAIMVVAPLVFDDVGYDPVADFQPVSQASSYEFGIAVGADSEVQDLSALIAWLKANPKQANLGVPATGSLPHFFALMVGEGAGVEAEVIGYRGSGPLITDLIGGQIPAAVDTLDTLLPQHEGGKLRVLASSNAARSPFASDIPTFEEAGLDVVATGWNTFFAPMSMPQEDVAALGAAIREVMAEDDTQSQFRNSKVEPVVSSPEETAADIDAYRKQWEPVVQRSGYRA